ncbi:PREDICTED: disease resistance protein RPH8A-like [Nicotiana attenuata]|uniref:Disease susceptibility protein lov1 n=1 Tax=Nicotiana attenuata TaxID=49451 RepID=A0A314LBN4_NICAT|nr:PREDICTED: disease resistance protein RPH8A-like [Nicotiana attenuata]OIT38913.1 disease susceptibility protein lov1 [Nicotiana attenuata]
MAEILLTVVIKKAADIAGELISAQVSRYSKLPENTKWIEREMRHMQSYLKDAESKQARDERIKNMIKDIEEIARDVEDILDEFLPKVASKGGKSLGFFKKTFHAIPFGIAAFKFVSEIEKIKRRVHEIDRVRTTYGIMDTGASAEADGNWDFRRSFLYADEPDVVGLDKDCQSLEAKLLDAHLRYAVVSIVGMPGLGKTTLGKRIYRRLQGNFECSALVYISQEPRMRELLLSIARQVGLPEGRRDEELEFNLSTFLKEKRYLVFLDDIWNTSTWDGLKLVFPNNCKSGSRLIITSRNNNVGRYIGGEKSLHKLQPLDPENSWKLFSKMITTLQETTINPPELIDIARKIVGRCGGVPLAIEMTAGMLRARERTEPEWNGILKKIGLDDQDKFSKILTLSYTDLPATLKPCFLYFGLFPEDTQIYASDLINMWVAEKFLGSERGMDATDIGADYLNILVARNLIQVASRGFDGRIKSCRIHDLLHDLCITLAEESNFFQKVDSRGFGATTTRIRRVALHPRHITEYVTSNSEAPKIRALLCFTSDYQGIDQQHLQHMISRFRFLRVLSLEARYSWCSLPNEIVNMNHLSYIKLKGTFHGEFPSRVCYLETLLTLDIRGCLGTIFLPTSVWRMRQVRHILLGYTTNFISSFSLTRRFKNKNMSLPDKVDSINLQTLYNVQSEYLKPSWFSKFINLRRLKIRYISEEILRALMDADHVLQKLEKLCLGGNFDDRTSISIEAGAISSTYYTQTFNLSGYHYLTKLNIEHIPLKKLPNSEAFPPNIIKLTISAFTMTEDPMNTLKRLLKLKILKLRDFYYNSVKKLDCSGVDSFPQLELLEIEDCTSLQELIVDDMGMPKIKKIVVLNCPSLKKISGRLQCRLLEKTSDAKRRRK